MDGIGRPSAAEAGIENLAVIAAVNRCATQELRYPKAALPKSKSKIAFFSAAYGLTADRVLRSVRG